VKNVSIKLVRNFERSVKAAEIIQGIVKCPKRVIVDNYLLTFSK